MSLQKQPPKSRTVFTALKFLGLLWGGDPSLQHNTDLGIWIHSEGICERQGVEERGAGVIYGQKNSRLAAKLCQAILPN